MRITPVLSGGAIIGVLSATALHTEAQSAAPTRYLSIASLAPAGSQGAAALETMNRELRRRTSNRLAFRWYLGGVQGDEAEVVRKIRTGRLDGGALSATGLQHMHRPVLAFQLPGMFPDPESFLRAYAALKPTLEQGFERDGYSLVFLSPAPGPRMFSRRAIRVPEDLRAARPWRWHDDPILPALYQEVGAAGVALGVGEVLMGLQTQRIDTVYAPPLAAIALQWSAHLSYMSERSASGSLNALVLSQRSASAISPADRATMQAVVAQAVNIYRPVILRAEESAIRTLQSRGITTLALTQAERQRWLAAFAGTRARLSRSLCDPAWMARVQAAGAGP
ncbi:MAG: TRAP transporter substrate-binding protein DctP [Myxococcales bacterium]|nr:TRAP transporter substrate-binding protein DctP [Myxococcales bacterium]